MYGTLWWLAQLRIRGSHAIDTYLAIMYCLLARGRFRIHSQTHMAPINLSQQPVMPFHFSPQLFYNRDFWLHALTLPLAVTQRLFEGTSTLCSNTNVGRFYLPAERAPHLRTLMAWPDDSVTENVGDLLLARSEVASIANAIAKHETVWMYASHQNIPIAESHLSRNVTVIEIEVDQLWLRDTGPVLVADSQRYGKLTGIDFNFNYWGGNSVSQSATDRFIARRVLNQTGIDRMAESIVAEGGALEADGEGTLLVTESSILNSNRNKGKDKAEMEEAFRELLGVNKTIWLEGVKGTDITNSHIDQLARFGADSRTVILSRPHETVAKTDPRYKAYEQARTVLSTSTNNAGQSFNIVEMKEAATVPRQEQEAEDLFWASVDSRSALASYDTIRDYESLSSEAEQSAEQKKKFKAVPSYTNFYLIDGAVIVPQFGEHRTDEAAVQTMKELFPDRVIETVMLDWMPWAGGGVHGAAVQWPAPGVC